MAPTDPGRAFYTVAEVADLIRVSKMTVYRMVKAGEIPAVRFGRSFRVPGEAVDELLARGTGSQRAAQ